MRRVGEYAIAALALALAGASASGASSSHKPVPKCPRTSTHVIAADVQATIYEASEPGKLPEYRGFYGCVHGRPQTYHLGEVPECGISTVCGGVRREQLAGAVVAYESFFSGEESRWYVAVRDLGSGRLLHHVPTGTPLRREPNGAGVGPVADLVVKADGSVAWIAEGVERSSPQTSTSPEIPYFDVYVSDRSGTRLLASGFDVSRSSLALGGNTVYWTQGGKPASAVLK